MRPSDRARLLAPLLLALLGAGLARAASDAPPPPAILPGATVLFHGEAADAAPGVEPDGDAQCGGLVLLSYSCVAATSSVYGGISIQIQAVYGYSGTIRGEIHSSAGTAWVQCTFLAAGVSGQSCSSGGAWKRGEVTLDAHATGYGMFFVKFSW